MSKPQPLIDQIGVLHVPCKRSRAAGREAHPEKDKLASDSSGRASGADEHES